MAEEVKYVCPVCRRSSSLANDGKSCKFCGASFAEPLPVSAGVDNKVDKSESAKSTKGGQKPTQYKPLKVNDESVILEPAGPAEGGKKPDQAPPADETSEEAEVLAKAEEEAEALAETEAEEAEAKALEEAEEAEDKK